MEKNEIKKELYKQKPKAYLDFIRLGNAYYICSIDNEGEEYKVRFEVPVDDMGDADFHYEMDAKLLIRYIN